MLIQKLREIQHQHGFLPDLQLVDLAKQAGVPLYRLQELASFYPSFRQEFDKPVPVEIRVCRDMTCRLRGSTDLLKLAEARNVPQRVRIEGVSCLGRCDRAPVAWVEGEAVGSELHAHVHTGLTRESFLTLVDSLSAGVAPKPDTDAGYATARNTDWTIDTYCCIPSEHTYDLVRKVVEHRIALGDGFVSPAGLGDQEAEAHIQRVNPYLWQIKLSGLGGMGGAGAPAYTKRLDVWLQPAAEKYVVANGDESEPGTFKDRELMLRYPHLIVEGMILTGLMIGARAGHIFIRHEYHEQITAMREAVARAEQRGACGDDLFASGLSFPITVFESPGGYILGEQSALLEAIEDRRGQPRNKPPDITSNGLYDQPTVLNNVETLAWLPSICRLDEGAGGVAYARGGSTVESVAGYHGPLPRFNGRRLFSISGDVVRPGVYEVPIGLPLGELLTGTNYGQGLIGKMKAVATSGPSGGLLPARWPLHKFHERYPAFLKRVQAELPGVRPLVEWFVARHLNEQEPVFDLLTAPLDLAFFGVMKELLDLPIKPLLGAGMAIYAEPANMLETAIGFTEFFRNESCGKCVPCRIGSQKLVNIGRSLLEHDDHRVPLEMAGAEVGNLLQTLDQTSICSLGTSASTPLASALAYFPSDCQ